MLLLVDYFNNLIISINILLIILNCGYWFVIVFVYFLYFDGLYGLGVEGGEVLGVY